MQPVSIIGCGYTGRRLAERLRTSGACVRGFATRVESDGSDDSHTEYLQRAATIARLPSPPLISRSEAERTLPSSSWSFLAESRRVDNSRTLTELGVALKYRDLDAGVRASLNESH
jgi:hypothetical protein